jgi:hypothetical protein
MFSKGAKKKPQPGKAEWRQQPIDHDGAQDGHARLIAMAWINSVAMKYVDRSL